jgi:hypothetical protein
MKMERILTYSSFLLLSLLSINQAIYAQKGKQRADNDTDRWRYEIEVVGAGVQGTYQVKAWTYSTNQETALEQGKKNAVHGVIFKGFGSNNGTEGQQAIVSDVNSSEINKEYWDSFFKTKDGKYMKFVTLANNGQIAASDRIKISKKEYKIGVIVSVNVAALRKQLESDGIVEPLGEGLGKKPSIMVLPADVWCTDKGYVLEYDNQGTKITLPDYETALIKDKELNRVISKIGELMADRGYPLVDLKATLDKIKNDNAKNSMNMSNETGSGIAESPIDVLNRTAKADIQIKIDWELTKTGPDNQVTFNMKAIDAFTSKQITAASGTGKPSSAAIVPVLMKEAVITYIDKFNIGLMSHFEDIVENGREGSLVVQVWDDAMENLETEYVLDDKTAELKMIINRFWMPRNTVNKQYKQDEASSNTQKFSQVRIPLEGDDGWGGTVDMDFAMFGSNLSSFLKKEFGIISKVQPRGLGEVYIILGGK